jgi:hypothetical protein
MGGGMAGTLCGRFGTLSGLKGPGLKGGYSGHRGQRESEHQRRYFH